MKQIQPLTVWFQGEEKQAEYFQLTSNDNLENAATFYYRLYEKVTTPEGDTQGAQLRDGNLTIDGQDYIDWGNQPANDVNNWAYDWAASKLNLTIV